jgi:hypothetical protein
MADESQSFNLGMGGVSLGMRGPAIINPQNPASYSAVDSLTLLFDIGASFSTARMSYDGSSVHPQNTRIDYIDASLRLANNLGLTFGLRPVTYVGYDFKSAQKMEDIDGYGERTATYTYAGSGGMHKVFGGLGWAPFKNFSIGANVGYLWGDYSHSSIVTFSESAIQSLARYYSGDINTYTLDFGAQLTARLAKQTTMTVGLTAGIGHKINEEANFINQKLNGSSSIGADTVHVGNAYEMPWSFGAGVVVDHAGRWKVGADYSCQLWKNCRFPQLVSTGGVQQFESTTNAFNNRHHISLGAQYMPRPDGFRFKDRVSYRAGLSYSTSYIKVNNDDGPKSYKASVGVGLPIINQYSNRSVLNIAAEYEHVAASSHLIKEDYLRLRLGLTFNARWFNQWKVQ